MVLNQSSTEPAAQDFYVGIQLGEGHRCRLTLGDWCRQYQRLPLLPPRPPLRGDKACLHDCNGVGVCNADTGVCDCPAGWTGEGCLTRLKRPCARVHSRIFRDGKPVPLEPEVNTDADGRDLDWTVGGWLAGRCPGICDDDIAACFCDNPRFGRLPAPPGSLPGAPPLRRGRGLADHCYPKQTHDGRAVPWGVAPYAQMYGSTGWCNATQPQFRCGCVLDGMHGPECEQTYEAYCTNQCSGHGTCLLGFCKCHSGWYGHDCARQRAALEPELSDASPGGRSPWLSQVVAEAPAALPQPLASSTRKRPFIYVYDLPAEFNSRLLQYRINKRYCVHRRWNTENVSGIEHLSLYGVETLLHELMLQSPHRTFDPEEADFFYVPTLTTCLIFPVFAHTDGPWYNAPMQVRPLQAGNFLVKAKRWIQEHYPYWDRRQGRDHIWLALHDEGACWMPTEVYATSIVLTHWGRLDLNHTSQTAYKWDNYDQYSSILSHPLYEPGDWRDKHRGHACYDPHKDLVIPSLKHAKHFQQSPMLGAPQFERDTLLFFKGDVGLHRLKWYSRGLRQQLYALSKEHDWFGKFKIRIGTGDEEHLRGSYSQQLARSQYCLVVPGDGWSGRAEDAILHGCIPVIIMDDVHAVFESILDWPSFSVRVAQADILRLPETLLAIPVEARDRMRRRLTRVWHRFAWTSGPFLRRKFEAILTGNQLQHPLQAARRRHTHNFDDDAFGTVVQWLAGRMQLGTPDVP